MAKQNGRMPTIWKVDDELWRLIKPLIDSDMPGKRTGRPPLDRRRKNGPARSQATPRSTMGHRANLGRAEQVSRHPCSS